MRSPVCLALARTHARAHTLRLLHAEMSPASQPVHSRASKRGASIKRLRLPAFSRRGLSRMSLNKSRGQVSLALPWLCVLYLPPFWLWISTPGCTPHSRCSCLFRSPSCLCSLFSYFTSVFHFPPRTHHQPLSPAVLSLPLLPRLSLTADILVTFPQPLCPCPSLSLNAPYSAWLESVNNVNHVGKLRRHITLPACPQQRLQRRQPSCPGVGSSCCLLMGC